MKLSPYKKQNRLEYLSNIHRITHNIAILFNYFIKIILFYNKIIKYSYCITLFFNIVGLLFYFF